MKAEDKIQRIKNVIRWGDEYLKFYKGIFPEEIFEKLKEISIFAKTIEGDNEAKFEAIKKKYPEML